MSHPYFFKFDHHLFGIVYSVNLTNLIHKFSAHNLKYLIGMDFNFFYTNQKFKIPS